MNNYEVLPWPSRIYEGLYNVSANSEEKAHIPRFYSTKMQIMINTLNNMPLSNNEVSGSQGISVLMANSLMFQRSPSKIAGYEDAHFSNFFGEALPLLMQGIPVHILHLENAAYPETWEKTKVLLMTYSNIKPLDPEAHTYLAKWVKDGGTIIYSGHDDDAYQNVYEWWNQGDNHYTSPSQHLFSLMNMPENAKEGKYDYLVIAIIFVIFIMIISGDENVKQPYINIKNLRIRNIFQFKRVFKEPSLTFELKDEGYDIFVPVGNGYRYGPSIMYYEDGTMDAWFASNGNQSEWDWITYKHSDDGINWSKDKILIKINL